MCMKNILKELKRKDHPHVLGALDIFKYIGIWLYSIMGCYAFNDYADCTAA